MSPREEKTGETAKDTSRTSMLLSLWRKVSGGGRGGKESPDAREEEPQVPEAALPEDPEGEPAPPPEPPFDRLPATDELTEYYLLFCRGRGKKPDRSVIGDFCAGPVPDEELLKQFFSQIESRSSAVMRAYRKQAQLAARKAEQLLREKRLEGEKTDDGEAAPESPAPPVDGQVLVLSAPDWSAAWGFVLPALGDGAPVSWETVLSALDEKEISFGIDNEVVDRLSDPENALTLVKLASCIPPVPGEDGRTEEYFPRTVGSPKIVENAQGIVDFNDLSWLTHIEAGTVICDIIPPTQGKPGTNIQGVPIRPYNGKKPPLPKGDNVVVGENGTSLVSKIDGQISFRDGKFHVNDVIVIKGDVDLSTGSIDVQGDVVIHGNVRAGFTVKASGNVTIGGLVEGCQITAGGSVVVNRGMNGNVTGSITAGKDVVCKYMENASVHAMGEIRMDSIVNCDISARGKVIVKTGRGVIIGGTICSMGGIEAKTIGNFAGRLTTLSIGPTPWFLKEKARVEESLEKIREEIRQKQSTGQTAVLQMKEKPLVKTLEEMEAQVDAAARRQIVAGNLYPPAQVSIRGVPKNINSACSPCRVFWDAKEGEVKVINV